MSEPRYTLPEARRELAHRECRYRGHDLDLVDVRTVGLCHAPVGIHCRRCERHWDVLPGRGGINLGEDDPQ